MQLQETLEPTEMINGGTIMPLGGVEESSMNQCSHFSRSLSLSQYSNTSLHYGQAATRATGSRWWWRCSAASSPALSSARTSAAGWTPTAMPTSYDLLQRDILVISLFINMLMYSYFLIHIPMHLKAVFSNFPGTMLRMHQPRSVRSRL